MEIWDAYTATGQKTHHTLVKGQPIPSGLYHLICEVLVFHEDGDILLVQRAWDKAGFPGYYEASAGGAALKGESALAAIQRELAEETGITDATFTQVGSNLFEPEQCLNVSFKAVTSIAKDQIQLQKREAIAYRWLNQPTYISLLTQPNTPELRLIEDQKLRHLHYYFNDPTLHTEKA